jgi:hypothetical protein
MHRFAFAVFAVAILVLLPFAAASTDSGVAVKPGDWIEYHVVVTGNPTSDLNITWAEMNVTAVEGAAVNVSVQTLFGNGTLFPEPYVPLNVATGAIGDGFFIPTTIKVGDVYSSEYEGNITITGTQRIVAGGAERTVLVGATNVTTYYWDQQTGIMVAAVSQMPNSVMHTTTSATNLWQPQILGLDVAIFYSLIATVALVLVGAVALLLWRRRR